MLAEMAVGTEAEGAMVVETGTAAAGAGGGAAGASGGGARRGDEGAPRASAAAATAADAAAAATEAEVTGGTTAGTTAGTTVAATTVGAMTVAEATTAAEETIEEKIGPGDRRRRTETGTTGETAASGTGTRATTGPQSGRDQAATLATTAVEQLQLVAILATAVLAEAPPLPARRPPAASHLHHLCRRQLCRRHRQAVNHRRLALPPSAGGCPACLNSAAAFPGHPHSEEECLRHRRLHRWVCLAVTAAAWLAAA